jgi:uncharacterized protein involved in exopolysaccharide biosynthesis
MPERLNPFEFLSALQSRWKRVAVVTLAAAALALVASLLLPKKYEATVLMMIQPAVGGPASPASMSPAYLDSLRSYEQFVQSDGVLDMLLREIHIDDDLSVENFRRSALRASLAKGTRVLQISVRLGDPRKAHDTALRLAQIAVESNTRVNRGAVERDRGRAGQDEEEAHKALVSAQAAIEKFRTESRYDELTREVEQQIERKVRYQRELSDVELDVAEYEGRVTALPSDQAARSELAGLRARRDALHGTLAALEKELAKSQAAHAAIEARRRTLDGAYQAAEKRFSTLSGRATDATSNVAVRHEELEIADPGTVPTQPASPRPLQNTILAAVLGFLAAAFYEVWVWNSARTARTLTRVDDRRPAPARW